jgi:hypothetical protein
MPLLQHFEDPEAAFMPARMAIGVELLGALPQVSEDLLEGPAVMPVPVAMV